MKEIFRRERSHSRRARAPVMLHQPFFNCPEVHVRTAFLRPAIACVFFCACAGQPAATVPSPEAAVMLDADEASALRRANAQRDSILAGSAWTDFEGDACNPGSLRTFTDSTAEGSTKMAQRVEALERIIVANGIDRGYDNAAGHALLRTLIGWESAATRPNWDVPAGAPVKQAIAAGLSGEFKNPETGKCESYVPFDTMNIVIPVLPTFQMPTHPKVYLGVFQGDSGLAKLRDAYYAANANVPNAVLVYTRVRALSVWNDYAVVAINRPAEQRGVLALPQGGGGASYIFHRERGEWRLLVIARTWG